MRTETTRVSPLVGLVLVLAVLALGGCGARESDMPGGCSDKQDNDRDGAADCADRDCEKVAECIPEISHAEGAGCSNGVDDDHDELLDCVDPDCRPAPGCEEHWLTMSLEKEQGKLHKKETARAAIKTSLWEDYESWVKSAGSRASDPMGGVARDKDEKPNLHGIAQEKTEQPQLYESARKVGVGQPHGVVEPVVVKYLETPEVVARGKQLVVLDREIKRLTGTVKGIADQLAALQGTHRD